MKPETSGFPIAVRRLFSVTQGHFGKLIHEEHTRHGGAHGHPLDDAKGLEAREPHGDLGKLGDHPLLQDDCDCNVYLLYIYIYVCVCMYMYVYIYIYMYVYVYVYLFYALCSFPHNLT